MADLTAPTRTRGEIITFYSYKGGTGRTMALANVACLLAERVGIQQPVLVVDWDLEAPGLHRFLPPRLVSQNAAMDSGLDATSGLIDIFTTLGKKLPPDRPESEEKAEAAVRAAFSSISFESFIADTSVPGVSILRAGRNDDGDYSRRVNTFDWEDLFNRAPTVYRAFAERLGEMFSYVLIDSRTGVTDISGICTSLLPEKLVVVFTPNRQSVTGVRELMERATSYRRNSDDLRPLLIYPLPSRIEASLQDLRTLWRRGSRDRNVVGYQPMVIAQPGPRLEGVAKQTASDIR
jgi:eukaryotic-like serine/threonine-protein kinase